MKSFLPPSTLIPSRRICLLSPSRARTVHWGARDNVPTHHQPDDQSFARLKFHPTLLSALRHAFPSVKHPTPIQYRFIDALSRGKDVLLKDRTGSGKSFALVLALLNQRRARPPNSRISDVPHHARLTSLVIVPHRDLAYQLSHWIERIYPHMSSKEDLSSLVQVIVRDSSRSLDERLADIQRTPPKILIGTPQALLEAVEQKPDALPLRTLSTVVVDEADYLIEAVPQMNDKFAKAKVERRIKRHPGATRLLLNHIYSTDLGGDGDDKETPVHPQRARHGHRQDRVAPLARPQLVVMSATLRNHLRQFLFTASGWFTKEPGQVVRITGEVSAHDGKLREVDPSAEDTLGSSSILHHVVVASQDGTFANLKEAGEPHVANSKDTDSGAGSSDTPSQALGPKGGESMGATSPFNLTAMEAVAAAFALDVPSVALLVLPSSAPVRRAVDELRLLGVNAIAMDVVEGATGKEYVAQSGPDAVSDNPTLLVSTLASTRGIDLPALSHVFILGMFDDVDSYLHVAGRVGRFGRRGKVINVIGDKRRLDLGKGKSIVRDEPLMMRAMLKKIGVRPTKFAHFE